MKIVILILLVIPIMLLSGFIWMISLGALSHIFNAPSLAIGYGSSILVSLIMSVLFGGWRSDKK